MGSIIVDVQMTVPYIPPSGHDVIASAIRYDAGGGFNVLSAVRRQGMGALYAGLIGQGPMGARIQDSARREGIALLHQPRPDQDTGCVITLLEPDGQRTFVTSPGLESRIKPADLAGLKTGTGDIVYVSGYDLLYPVSGDSIMNFLSRMDDKVRLVFDPGPLISDIPAHRLDFMRRRAWIITANRRELCHWAQDDDLAHAARSVSANRPVNSLVVARNGSDGAWVTYAEQLLHVSSRPACVVDTTGAGDTHTGVLVALMAEGWPVIEAVQAANIAASLSCEKLGPATCPPRPIIEQNLFGKGSTS